MVIDEEFGRSGTVHARTYFVALLIAPCRVFSKPIMPISPDGHLHFKHALYCQDSKVLRKLWYNLRVTRDPFL